MPFVHESLVIERDKKISSTGQSDSEQLEALDLNHPLILKTIMDENLKELKQSDSCIREGQSIQLYPTEFLSVLLGFK